MDPKLGTRRRAPAGRRHPRVRRGNLDLRCVVRPERRRAGQRGHASGANRFAGTGYEFFRNGALDSRNAFAPEDEPAPDYNRHQFGGSIGGPIVAEPRVLLCRLRADTRLREGITRVTNVPTPAERAGRFSQSLFAAAVSIRSQATVPGRSHPGVRSEPDRRRLSRRSIRCRTAPRRLRTTSSSPTGTRRRGSVRRAARSRLPGRLALDRAVQLQRPAAVRAVRGRRLRGDSRLRQRRRPPRPEPVARHTAGRSGARWSTTCASASTASRIGVFPENPQIDNASVGLRRRWPPIPVTPG